MKRITLSEFRKAVKTIDTVWDIVKQITEKISKKYEKDIIFKKFGFNFIMATFIFKRGWDTLMLYFDLSKKEIILIEGIEECADEKEKEIIKEMMKEIINEVIKMDYLVEEDEEEEEEEEEWEEIEDKKE